MDNSGKQTNDFFAPMAQSPIGIVFLNDFVIVMNGGVHHIYHIQQFLCHVSFTLSGIYSHNNILVYRMAVRVCLQMRSC